MQVKDMMQRDRGFNLLLILSLNSGSFSVFIGVDLAEEVSPGSVIPRLRLVLANALSGELCQST